MALACTARMRANPQAAAQEGAHVLVGDSRIEQDWKYLGQQAQPVLSLDGASGQAIGELVFGVGLPSRDSLVEHLHDLIEHVDGRLG